MDFVAVAAFYLFIYVFAHGGVLSALYLHYIALFLLFWLWWGGCVHKLHVPTLSISILKLCRNYDLGFGSFKGVNSNFFIYAKDRVPLLGAFCLVFVI